MIEYNGKNYELKFNIGRIEKIESVTDMPTMAELQRTKGMLSLSSLKTYFAYSLKEEGADVFVMPKQARDICESLIEEEGYPKVLGTVLEALERDCPFFFRGD